MFDRGFDNRKTVLGAAHVEKSGPTPMRSTARSAAGDRVLLGRGLGRRDAAVKTRSMLNIAMLTAMNQHHELAVHVKGALTNGVTKDEIQAVLMQALVYCGAPAALAAFRTASTAIADWEKEHCGER